MDDSLLSLLSAELRNKIYRFAIHEQRPVAISKNFWTEAALLRTCKQIRNEAELVFYAANDFTCCTNLEDGNTQCLLRWLQQGPSNKLQLIQSLTISVEFRTQRLPYQITEEGLIDTPNLCQQLTEQLRNADFGERSKVTVLNFNVRGASDDIDPEQSLEFRGYRSFTGYWQAFLLTLNVIDPLHFDHLIWPPYGLLDAEFAIARRVFKTWRKEREASTRQCGTEVS